MERDISNYGNGYGHETPLLARYSWRNWDKYDLRY